LGTSLVDPSEEESQREVPYDDRLREGLRGDRPGGGHRGTVAGELTSEGSLMERLRGARPREALQ
jgi:hypothetical protein